MHDGTTDRPAFSLELHGARGLFSLLVFVFHVENSGLPQLFGWEFMATLLDPLKFGVELFFALSGYVIIGTLARARTPLAFLFDRATRIYPVLWIGVLTVVLLSLVSGREAPASFAGWPLLLHTLANLAALPNLMPFPLFLAPAWTLSYELCFYLFGCVYLVCRRRLSLNIFPILLVLSLPIIDTHPRALFFLSGILVATGYSRYLRLPIFAERPILSLLVFLWSWNSVHLLNLPEFRTMTQWLDGPAWLYAVIAFASAALFLDGLVRSKGHLSAFLRSPAMLYFGTISYSFYLWHPVVMAIVKSTLASLGLFTLAGNLSQLLFFLAALPPSILVGHLSQRWIER
ncbi:acyltransferase family protein, partial [Aureimonas sp. AU40]|uniref:acyltransferase family protein n=1 Tax=Aureimonas sp. AU40 TaxID=1637747 RepID=UPI000780B1C2